MTSAEQSLDPTVDNTVLTNQSIKDQIRPVSLMNRAERRDRIRYFQKMLDKHVKHKSKKVREGATDEEAKEDVKKINTWIMRYGVLVRKLRELHGLDGNHQGSK